MISKIGFKKYRSFKDYNEINVKPITLLVGPNSAGKSSIIKLIKFLYQSYTEKSVGDLPIVINGSKVNLIDYKNLFYKKSRGFEVLLEVTFRETLKISDLFAPLNFKKVKITTQRVQPHLLLNFKFGKNKVILGEKLIFSSYYRDAKDVKEELEDLSRILKKIENGEGIESDFEEVKEQKINKKQKYTYLELNRKYIFKEKHVLLSLSELVFEKYYFALREKKFLKKFIELNNSIFNQNYLLKNSLKSFKKRMYQILKGLGSLKKVYKENLKEVLKVSGIDYSIFDLFFSMYADNLMINNFPDFDENFEFELFYKIDSILSIFKKLAFNILKNKLNEEEVSNDIFFFENLNDSILLLQKLDNQADKAWFWYSLVISHIFEFYEKVIREETTFIIKNAFNYPLEEYFIKTTNFISPLRNNPQETYSYEEMQEYFYIQNNFFVPIVKDGIIPGLISEKFNYYLNELGLNYDLVIEELIKSAVVENKYSIRLFDKNYNEMRFLDETGFGVSQILPIIFNVVKHKIASEVDFVDKFDTFIEQPELHLHPNMQYKLASVFADAHKGGNFILETHSEHLVRGIQIEIAKGNLKPEDVAVYYVDKDENGISSVRLLELDENGNFTTEWPSGFMDLSSKAAYELLNTQLKNKSK